MERTLPAVRLAAIGLLVLFWASLQIAPAYGDAAAYYYAELGPELYAGGWNVDAAYVYPPPFRQVLEPLTWLPWPAFYALWSAILVVALAWLVGPIAAVLLLIPYEPFRHSTVSGGINILIPAAMVAGAWAFLPLTKVTPGVALLWFAVRREWRPLAIALGITAAVSAVSYAAAPDLWAAWLERMRLSLDAPPLPGWQLPGPLALRLMLAAGLVAYAAWRGWRWLLPVAVFVALPNPVLTALVVLAGIPRLLAERTLAEHHELQPSPDIVATPRPAG